MKSYVKITCILAGLFGVAILVFLLITKETHVESYDVSRENIVLLNRIARTAEENRNDLSVLDGEEYGIEYAILDEENHLLYARASHEIKEDELSLEKAMQKRLPYLYIGEENKTWGVVVLLEDGTKGYQELVRRLTLAICIFCALILGGVIGYGAYVHKNVTVPFTNMKDFAAKVAQGKLDEPLTMDRNNLFGPFTESFDIMREELAASKERELLLQKKERELVASLSHDLKTPVTGIKLTAELMQMRMSVKRESENASERDAKRCITFTEEEMAQLSADAEGIWGKAEQIATLLSDLFTSAMDDLGEFKVNCQDEDARILEGIVKSFDDGKLVVLDKIPEVILKMDKKCMAQVIGNIISNSYKYANTKIDVSFRLSDPYLEMQISDHGPGVPSDELDLITNKFYRGKDWASTDKDGHGLGLYIAKTLMTKMKGDLIAESGGGLSITLVIPLA